MTCVLPVRATTVNRRTDGRIRVGTRYCVRMRVQLDGNRVRTEVEFHREVGKLLDFGPYYGANLDASWDRLSTDVPRPVHLVWAAADASRAAMGSHMFDRIERVLLSTVERDAAFNWTDRFTYELA